MVKIIMLNGKVRTISKATSGYIAHPPEEPTGHDIFYNKNGKLTGIMCRDDDVDAVLLEYQEQKSIFSPLFPEDDVFVYPHYIKFGSPKILQKIYNKYVKVIKEQEPPIIGDNPDEELFVTYVYVDPVFLHRNLDESIEKEIHNYIYGGRLIKQVAKINRLKRYNFNSAYVDTADVETIFGKSWIKFKILIPIPKTKL